MFIDVGKAQERIKYLDGQINRKQTDIRSLICSLTTSSSSLQQASEIFAAAGSRQSTSSHIN